MILLFSSNFLLFPTATLRLPWLQALYTCFTKHEITCPLTVWICSRALLKLLNVIWKNMPSLGCILRICTFRCNNWNAALVRNKFANLVPLRYHISSHKRPRRSLNFEALRCGTCYRAALTRGRRLFQN